MKKAPGNERRRSTLRRQFNESFCGPDGGIAVTKVIAVFSQIAVLAHMGRSFDALVEKPESLLIVLTFLIAPDILKKVITMKYGNGHAAAAK